MTVLYKTFLLTESMGDALSQWIPIFPQVIDECRICGQQLTYYIQIHTDDPH
jgi:hypothetical protein